MLKYQHHVDISTLAAGLSRAACGHAFGLYLIRDRDWSLILTPTWRSKRRASASSSNSLLRIASCWRRRDCTTQQSGPKMWTSTEWQASAISRKRKSGGAEFGGRDDGHHRSLQADHAADKSVYNNEESELTPVLAETESDTGRRARHAALSVIRRIARTGSFSFAFTTGHRSSTSSYIAGNTRSVRSVDVTSPPITTVASGRCTSEP